MKKVLLLLTIIIFAASCKHQKLIDKIPPTSDLMESSWDRIRVPDGGTAMAVIGSIDDTLLVTTMYHTYIVTNKGKNVTRSNTKISTIPGLAAVQDTIYAYAGQGFDQNTNTKFAGFPNNYTVDKGLTWHFFTVKPSLSRVDIGRVTTKDDITYELEYHTGPDQNGQGNSYIHQTTINRIVNGVKSPFKHPVKDADPSNLYLDNKERLYITSGDTVHATGVVIGKPASSPAYVYISKAPINQ